ncbi:MAG: FAD-dependent oxidoreductase [Candidatus Dependentiae bacterium]
MKIGIIGGGIAGLATAWLLEQEHEVVLFEKNNFFGGHAQTIYLEEKGKSIPIEIGFEFFNERMYPHFCSLLKILSVPTTIYPFTYSFFSQHSSSVYVLPPIQGHKIFWHTLTPLKILALLQLKKTIHEGIKLIQSKEKLITLDEFAKEAKISSSFMRNFFYPLFSAGWGVNYEEFATFSAYNVLAYIVKNKPIGLQPSYWYQITAGMTYYINKLVHNLTKTHLYSSTSAEHIYYENGKYVIEASKKRILVDHLIIATDAHKTGDLLRNISHTTTLRNTIKTLDYIPATLAIHEDRRFMPPCPRDWSVANVWQNNNFSTLTIFKNKPTKNPCFRSWLLPEFPEPKTIHAIQHYHHAKPNKNYFKTQEIIALEQGKNNLWVAGLYTNDIDSHESALNSAIYIAQQLAPTSERLKKLLAL